MSNPAPSPTASDLAAWVRDARRRTIDLVVDLQGEAWLGPKSAIVNPPSWEVGHVGWFYERWILRHARGRPPIRPDEDALYNSAGVPHDTRWNLACPPREQTFEYLREVHDAVLEALEGAGGNVDEKLRYFVMLSVYHEDMHTEAFTYTRQTHEYSAPRWSGESRLSLRERTRPFAERKATGDAEFAGGTFLLGNTCDEPFVFDNEQCHPLELRPFRISRTAVTQEEFAEFVESGGYQRDDLWSEQGLRWRVEEKVDGPLYWQREPSGRWLRRDFDRWVPLDPRRPMLHVNWYEADAFCRWAGRRLPTEAEWESAAAGGFAQTNKRRYAWGDDPPNPQRANLDWRAMGTLDVDALPDGDTPGGCRQMIGNVWEWTADDFLPFPGFEAGPYLEYSVPWFGDHKVLRGGCWCTRSRLIRNAYRNFYQPHRRDIWAGFRTCAVER